MSRYSPAPIRQLDLELDDVVRLSRYPDPWTVQALSKHFAVLVQQAPEEDDGVLQYTVLDWRNGVRGPCDLIGQGWGEGTYTTAECSAMLVDFEWDDEQDPARLEALAAGRTSWVPTRSQLRVSARNWTTIDVFEVNGEPVQLEWLG